MLLKRTILYTLTFFFCVVVNAQNTGGNYALISFDALRSGNQAAISWTVRAGYSCAAVTVLHSTDSVNFTAIFEYPGICGASTQHETYTFTHQAPASGKNFYKMDLDNYGTSAVVNVNMVPYGNGGFVVVTSGTDVHQLYFNNPARTSFVLEVFSISGVLLYRKDEITGEELTFPTLNGMKGVIIFHLTGKDGTVYSGKYVKS
ncbi:MAG: hypothetical protein M3R17_10340 [Bacteroidota bacterium]|nr:hypothetical protein [Bacteroidota bacterium]